MRGESPCTTVSLPGTQRVAVTCRWIHVDQKKLHAQTQGHVWTLTANDLEIKKDCLDTLGIPLAVRSGTVKKLTVVSCVVSENNP